MGELMVRAKMQLESPGLWASFMSVWFSWSSRRLSGLLRRSIIVLSLTAQFGRWESVKMTTKAKATATACCLFEFLLSGLAHGHCCCYCFCYGWASWRVSSVQHALIIARFIFTHCSWLADEETKATTPPAPFLLPFVCVCVGGQIEQKTWWGCVSFDYAIAHLQRRVAHRPAMLSLWALVNIDDSSGRNGHAPARLALLASQGGAVVMPSYLPFRTLIDFNFFLAGRLFRFISFRSFLWQYPVMRGGQ